MQWSTEHPLPGDRASATGRAALEGRPIHIPDVLADPEYGASGHQQAAGDVHVAGWRRRRAEQRVVASDKTIGAWQRITIATTPKLGSVNLPPGHYEYHSSRYRN